jgi:hypothetical protein
VEWYIIENTCYGLHSRPLVFLLGDKIKLPEGGIGYTSKRHLHGGEIRYFLDENRRYLYFSYEGLGEKYMHGQREGWLIGYDDGHLFCYRVPSTCSSIDEVLNWLIPAKVKRAQKCVRQGDFFFIPSTKMKMEALKGTNHVCEETEKGLRISHPQHGILELEGKNWEAVPVRAIRGRGD